MSVPSKAALALAVQMRTFDRALTDLEVAYVARGIDQQRALGAQLSPKKKRLANGVDPYVAPLVPPREP